MTIQFSHQIGDFCRLTGRNLQPYIAQDSPFLEEQSSFPSILEEPSRSLDRVLKRP